MRDFLVLACLSNIVSHLFAMYYHYPIYPFTGSFRGDIEQPDIQELKVGPLPEPTEHEVIKYSYYKDPIPYHNRNPLADHELRMWESFMKKDIGRLDPIIKPATGG